MFGYALFQGEHVKVLVRLTDISSIGMAVTPTGERTLIRVDERVSPGLHYDIDAPFDNVLIQWTQANKEWRDEEFNRWINGESLVRKPVPMSTDDAGNVTIGPDADKVEPSAEGGPE